MQGWFGEAGVEKDTCPQLRATCALIRIRTVTTRGLQTPFSYKQLITSMEYYLCYLKIRNSHVMIILK
jgi:hypothetical protein